MTEINMNKVKLVGKGYAEMPQDGRRYRFEIERYRHEDGSEWGSVVSMKQIPDAGPLLWIPSWGAQDPQESDHLYQEYEYEKDHPTGSERERWGEHRERVGVMRQSYDEARDHRAELVKRNHRTAGR